MLLEPLSLWKWRSLEGSQRFPRPASIIPALVHTALGVLLLMTSLYSMKRECLLNVSHTGLIHPAACSELILLAEEDEYPRFHHDSIKLSVSSCTNHDETRLWIFKLSSQ